MEKSRYCDICEETNCTKDGGVPDMGLMEPDCYKDSYYYGETTCDKCGAVLSYDARTDTKTENVFDSPSTNDSCFRVDYKKYIICPQCKNEIVAEDNRKGRRE